MYVRNINDPSILSPVPIATQELPAGASMWKKISPFDLTAVRAKVIFPLLVVYTKAEEAVVVSSRSMSGATGDPSDDAAAKETNAGQLSANQVVSLKEAGVAH